MKKEDTEKSDIVADELDDSVVAEESAADTIKKLREKLKKSEAETAGISDRLAKGKGRSHKCPQAR